MSPALRSARKCIRRLAPATALVVGVLLVAHGVVTLVWQEPLTTLSAQRAQGELRAELRRTERAAARRAAPSASTGAPSRASRATRRERLLARARAAFGRVGPGDAFGRIVVPRLGLDRVVVFGSGPRSLRRGPGLLTDAALPGLGGTAAIAGHRTTYSAPFRDIDRLRRGDRITLRLPYATIAYRVEGTRIVRPDAVGALRSGRRERLVLSACHPLHSAAQRILVFARVASTRVRAA